MLITINVDNVGTISNVYWSDSIFFSCEVWCQLGIEITNVQLLFIESYSTPCKRIWIPESGKFCLWNPESEMFCWWNLQSGIFCLWNLESGIFCFWNPESEIFACWIWNPGYFACGIWNLGYFACGSGIRDILLVESRFLGFLIRDTAQGIRNPSSTDKESRIQYLKSGIHGVETRVQDRLGFLYMGHEGGEKKGIRKLFLIPSLFTFLPSPFRAYLKPRAHTILPSLHAISRSSTYCWFSKHKSVF